MTTLGRTRLISMAAAAAGILLWTAVPALRGHDVPALAIVGLLMGLPHGAVDYLLPQGGSWRPGPGTLARTLGKYLIAVVIGLIVVLLSPVTMYFAILALSVFHWGSGDAAVRRESAGEPGELGGPVEILAYGGSAVVSGAFWPEHVRHLLGTVAPGVADRVQGPTLIGAVAVLAAGAVFAVRMARRRQWLAVGEAVLLAVLPMAVPPLVFFGLFFGPWHSLRQTVRLIVDARRPGGLTPWFFPLMAWGTAGALAFVAVAMAVAAHLSATTDHYRGGDWLIAALAAVVAPHVLIVLRYDLWKRHSEPLKVG